MKRVRRTAHAGRYLAKARIRFGLTQRDIAWKMDTSRGVVAHIESGRTHASIEQFCAYCAIIELAPGLALADIVALGVGESAPRSRGKKVR